MIRLGGIKFSEELVQITVTRASHEDTAIHELLRLITAQKINIPFLCHSDFKNGHNGRTSFCVDSSDFDAVEQLTTISSPKINSVSFIESVGSLTIFPHKNSFLILGKILTLLGNHNFPIYSMSSSISAFAFNSDYKLLDEIASCLLQHFELPENHAPFRPEFQLKEISE